MTATQVRSPDEVPTRRVGRRTPGPRAPRPHLTWREHLTGWGFVLPASVIVIGLSVFPAGWAFLISRQKTDLISPPQPVGWDNYRLILEDPNAAAAARHTLLFAALFVPTSILLGMLLAIALNRPLRLQWFYRTCIFVPFVASAAATGILANFVFDPAFGLANNLLRVLGLPRQGFLEDPNQALAVLVLIALWGGTGFNVVIYLAALQNIPEDVVEAAIVDGAGPVSVFRYVTLPEMAPVTVFVAIWQTIIALQLFDIVYTTTKGQPGDATVTIVYYLYRQAFELFRAGYGSALAYCVFAVTMLCTGLLIWYARRTGTEAF
ncbi:MULTISPECIES: carbohydrate ABC transporter permease [unclassified Nocardioides]|uniref:carbohydrate ABC transporter permease n=1 Tax=unclassified Nocardioides TaxID=2615069 RepID=UPI0036123DAF